MTLLAAPFPRLALATLGVTLVLGASTGLRAEVSPGLAIELVSAAPDPAPLASLSLVRGLPVALRGEVGEVARALPDETAFRVVVHRAKGNRSGVEGVRLTSLGRDGEQLDSSGEVPLAPIDCPAFLPARECFWTRPLLLVPGELDREHPALEGSSLRAVPGGRLTLRAGETSRAVAVLGATALGHPEALYGLRMRVGIARVGGGGTSSLGGADAGARATASAALSAAVAVYGPCGVVLATPVDEAVRVTDPVVRNLITVGCADGLSASGGVIELETPRGPLQVALRPGSTPLVASLAVQGALVKKGYQVQLFRNALGEGAAGASFDLTVRDTAGAPVALSEVAGRPLSSDPTLRACLGEVDFGDGLHHFSDLNSAAGTLEERTLIRQGIDDDPATMDVFIIPEFGGEGRIGESFIHSAGASLENVLIIDRSGIRALPRSMTLAHEMGHVLFHLPGHPDDFGVDQPSHLMDADASDASVFGPRRLELADCRRLLTESGPRAVLPLVTPLPPADGQSLEATSLSESGPGPAK